MRQSLGYIMIGLTLILGLGACDSSSGTSVWGDQFNGGLTESVSASISESTESSSLWMSSVSGDGRVMVKIPLEVFGESDLSIAGSSVEVSLDGETIARMGETSLNYADTIRMVWFYVEGVASGDVLSFTVSRSNGMAQIFSGTVSDASEASATNSVSGDVTTLPDSTEKSITFGTLSDAGKILVTIPLSVFGDDASDLQSAVLNLDINGEALLSGEAPEDYYFSSSESVKFYLTSITDGDEISLTVELSDGTTLRFEGMASTASDSIVYAD